MNIQQNTNIHFLRNAVYNRYKRLYFNITGNLEDDITNQLNHPVFNNTKINLTVSPLSNKVPEVNCTIYYIKNDIYTLKCKLNSSIDCDLQNSCSIFDDKRHIILFDNNQSQLISDDITDVKKFNYNKSKKISGGIIALIIIIPIVLSALAIFIVYYLIKINNNNKTHIPNISNVSGNMDNTLKLKFIKNYY